ncbi:MAG: hypothetical protein EOM08_15450 [Clostridia bacterium]|nr:hypothetical protein [Clostridia bacterium]
MKTVLRKGKTLAHGHFSARQTVYSCAKGCQYPAGAKITQAGLEDYLPPGGNVGYDVVVFVGLQRFAEKRQREQIQAALIDDYGIRLSTGEISTLAKRFVDYLGVAFHINPLKNS